MSKVRTAGDGFESYIEDCKTVWRKHNPELILKDGSLIRSAEAEAALDYIETLADAPLIGPNYDAVLDGVTVEELDNAAMAAYGDWVGSTEKREQTEMGMCRAIRAAVLTASGIAIPEGYGTVQREREVLHAEFGSREGGIKITITCHDGYVPHDGGSIAFLAPRKKEK